MQCAGRQKTHAKRARNARKSPAKGVRKSSVFKAVLRQLEKSFLGKLDAENIIDKESNVIYVSFKGVLYEISAFLLYISLP